MKRELKPFWKKSFCCQRNEGCGKCQVCKYLEFREWAEGCSSPGDTIERNEIIETFLHQILLKHY